MLSESSRNYKRHDNDNHDKLKVNFKGKITFNLFLFAEFSKFEAQH